MFLLVGLYTYSYPCLTEGANAARGLAMVVASGHKNFCLHEGGLYFVYKIKCYIDASVLICYTDSMENTIMQVLIHDLRYTSQYLRSF